MEKDKVLIATYGSLATGRNAVQKLLDAGFKREDIGLAAKEGTGDGSMVTVTVRDDDHDKAKEALNTQSPQTLTTRDVQWLKEGGLDQLPDAQDYTAVELAE